MKMRQQLIELMTPEGKTILRVRLANRFWSRLKGLLGLKDLPPQEGLLLEPCRAVHTIGMKFPIDILFLSKEDLVLAVYQEVPPGRPGITVKNACKVLETAAGVTRSFPCEPGIQLVFKTWGD